MTPAAAGSPRWAQGRGPTPGRSPYMCIGCSVPVETSSYFYYQMDPSTDEILPSMTRLVILNKQQLNPREKGLKN